MQETLPVQELRAIFAPLLEHPIASKMGHSDVNVKHVKKLASDENAMNSAGKVSATSSKLGRGQSLSTVMLDHSPALQAPGPIKGSRTIKKKRRSMGSISTRLELSSSSYATVNRGPVKQARQTTQGNFIAPKQVVKRCTGIAMALRITLKREPVPSPTAHLRHSLAASITAWRSLPP